MSKFIFAICLLGLLIGLGACQSKKENTIVSPDGYVLRDVTDPADSITQDWIYDVNDGAYKMEHSVGSGAGQIVITDREGRLCAAYGYNQCQPQIAKVYYENDMPKTLCLMWIAYDADENWDDVGMMFDKLLKGTVKPEEYDSIEICTLTYDSMGRIIEVSDSLSGKCLKAPDDYYITSEIVETGTMNGHHDFSFRIKNMILSREKIEPYVEKEYSGYELCREIRHISPMMVVDAFTDINGDKDTLKYMKEVKDNLTIYSKVFRDGNTEVSVWQNGYLLKKECISKWGTVIWRKEYTLMADKQSYSVKSYKYDYTEKVLSENDISTIKVSEIEEMNLKDIIAYN